jgi:hypothetical protein
MKNMDNEQNTQINDAIEDSTDVIENNDTVYEETDAADEENFIEQLTTGNVYENSKEKYQDNLSSAITFLVCGIAGLVIVLLNDFGVLHFFSLKGASGILTNVVLIGLFAAFIVIAFISFKAARNAKSKIAAESRTNTEIQDWLSENLNAEIIDSSYDGSELADEMKYFNRSSYIKNVISEKYPDLKEEIADAIADEYIEKIFSGKNV